MKNIYYILLFSLFVFSCTTSKIDAVEESHNNLNINIASSIKTLYPPLINDVYSMQVASQIFEGLVKYNPIDLSIEPAIAKTWEISEDYSEYTFFLKKDVFFHDNTCFPGGKGRKLTANDVVYSFTKLCSKDSLNNNYKSVLAKIVGGKEYYESGSKADTKIEGIEIINDFLIKIKLVKPSPFFLNSLALPSAAVFPKEGIEKYKDKNYVGTGAFYLKQFPNDNNITLIRNNNYHAIDVDNNRLPYLDTIFIGIESSIQKEIHAFNNENIDVIMNLPNSYLSEFMDKNIKSFESLPPKYIVTNYTESENNETYNLMNSNIHNLYTNNMNYLDFSIVYLENIEAKSDLTE